MTSWDDRITDHGIHSTFADLQRELDDAGAGLGDADELEALTRLQRIIALAVSSLDASDTELVPPALLDRMDSAAHAILNEISNFRSNGNAAHLDAANVQADGFLEQEAALPVVSTVEGADEVREAVASARRSMGQHLRRVEEQAGAVREELTGLKESIEGARAEIDQQKARLDTAIADYQAQFSSAQDERSRTFEQAAAEHRAAFGEAISRVQQEGETATSQARSRFDEISRSLEEEGRTRLDDLDNLKEQAVRVVSVIGSTGVTGNYQRVANEEKRIADLWRYGAVVAFTAAAVGNGFVLIFEFVYRLGITALLAARLSISIPLLALAGYAVAESRYHRHREGSNRQVELQLASLDPYIAEFPEVAKHKVKEEAVNRFFPGLATEPTHTADTE